MGKGYNRKVDDAEIQMEDGIPSTIKDKRYHECGLKSIKNTVKKYEGSVTISTTKGWLELRILIPLPKAYQELAERIERMKKVHHICIQTNHYKESLDFYRTVLGFELKKETPDFHGRDYNTWISLGDFMIELQTPKKKEIFRKCGRDQEGIVHICFYTEDMEEEYRAIKEKGIKTFLKKNGEDIYKVGDGRLFKLEAPEGTVIEFRDKTEI